MAYFRKITALYLIAALLLPCFFTVRAEESKDNMDGYYIYDVRSYDPMADGALLGAVITGVTDRDALPEDISIPDTLGGYPVKEIEGNAFSDCSNIRSVFIPNSVISIHPNAFPWCYNLTALHADPDNTRYSSKDGVLFSKDQTVLTHYPQGIQNDKYTVPDGVTKIGSYAFFNQSYLTEVDIPSSVTVIAPHAFEGAFIQSVVLPANLTEIGENAFTGAFIQSIAIPAGVEVIGSSAFSDCKYLTSVTIADGVKHIGPYAFSGSSLENLFIPKSVVTVDATVFSNCWNLTAIEVAENNPNYLSRDGILFNKAQTALIKYPQNNAVKDYGVPDGTTEVLPDAFSGCGNLSSVKLPDSVKTIGEFAFASCWNLTALYIPESVTTIGEFAFSGCDSLSTLRLPVRFKDSASDLGLDSIKDVSYFCMVDYILQKENGVLSKLSRIRVDYGDPLPVYKDLPTLDKGFRYIYYQPVYTSLSDGSLVLRDKQKLSSNEVVTADCSVLICKEAVQCTVTLTEGDTVTEKNVWIDSDLTVRVTRMITAYTVTFVGDYEGTQIIAKNTAIQSPPIETGYVYRYTDESNRPWSPDTAVTRDITLTAKKLNDRCEVLNLLGCDGVSVDAENHIITATVYQKKLRMTPVISAGASCIMKSANNETVYDSNGDIDAVLTLDYGANEYTLTVTAESGKIAAYTLKITLKKVSDLGYMTALTYGRTIGFQPTKKIKGSPTIKARYSKDNNRWSYTDAEYNPDVNMIYVKNLESSTTYYFIIEADYGYEAPVCNTNTPIMVKTGLSDECLILCANTPPSTDVDHENGTVSGLWVQNIFSTCDIDITVSDGATWEMFLSPDMETPAKSKTVALEEGKTTNVYIRVTAEDRISTKTYTLPIYRWTKSDQPKISIENGLVCITARENSAIYYTVDGSYPTPGSKTTLLYTKPFLCADRKTVKAIAKDRDRDEASEPVGFEVRGAAKTAITSAVFSSASANQYSYEVYLETLEEIGLSGTLYIAAYDDRGVLTAIETVAVNTNQKDHLETGTLFPAAAPKKYTVYFCDAALKPLTEKR